MTRAQAVIFVNAPVFANAQEYDAVDGLLHGKVKLALGELRVAQGDVAGKQFAPRFDLFEKRGINLGGAFFAFAGLSVLVKRALQDCFTGKDGGYFFPALRIFLIVYVERAGGCGFIGLNGFYAAVVDGEFFKVGQYAQGQLGRPGIAAQLKGRVDIILEIDRGLFGFEKKFAGAADAETVVRGLGEAAYLDGVFVDNVLVGLGIAAVVVNIPAEGLEKGVDEFTAQLGFIVGARFVGINLLTKPVNKVENKLWSRHAQFPLKYAVG